MRAAFGLVSLLVAMGIIAWMWGKGYGTSAVTDPGVQHRIADARQFSGRGREDEMPFDQSLRVETQQRDGKTSSVLVLAVVTGGPADAVYGLKVGDAITDIGELSVRDQVQSDQDAMAYLLQFGYERSAPLKIVRNGQKMTLSVDDGKPVQAAATSGSKNSADNPINVIGNQ
jgi:hypothetical protein